MGIRFRQYFPLLFRYEALFRRGFVRVLEKVFNLVLTPVFGLSLSLTRVPKNSDSFRRKIFGNSKTVDTGRGFYVLSPMPSEEDLLRYYQSLYWQGRRLEGPVVRVRDFLHFNLISEKAPDLVSSGKAFLNFGAGHGGVSILMAQNGVTVVNVEPNGFADLYEKDWSTVQTIAEVSDNSIDLCYGSHSLEHVADLDSVISHLERVLRPPGWVFWEVPNAESPAVGSGVRIPHTYYFKEEFFRTWLAHIESIQLVNYPLTLEETPLSEECVGDSIRVMGHLGLTTKHG